MSYQEELARLRKLPSPLRPADKKPTPVDLDALKIKKKRLHTQGGTTTIKKGEDTVKTHDMFTSVQEMSGPLVHPQIQREYDQIVEYARLQELYKERGTSHDRELDDCNHARHKRSKTNEIGADLRNMFSIDQDNSLFLASNHTSDIKNTTDPSKNISSTVDETHRLSKKGIKVPKNMPKVSSRAYA